MSVSVETVWDDSASVRPLDGVRVLDVSGRIGSYCGRLLADLGADVILVELPTGHDLRRSPPFRDVGGGVRESLAFAYYNSNKRGITLNWTSADALPLLGRLGRTADAMILSPTVRRPVAAFDPTGAARAGLTTRQSYAVSPRMG